MLSEGQRSVGRSEWPHGRPADAGTVPALKLFVDVLGLTEPEIVFVIPPGVSRPDEPGGRRVSFPYAEFGKVSTSASKTLTSLQFGLFSLMNW